ncbi:MAG TPA: 3-dehydroquinate synthase, partial [Deltaproteobacteria bacterium]|nr:3-dehydroquinate synthase [Deltaproteobacteria bacterium]
EVASSNRPCVVAAGGGLPVDPANRRIMKASGCIVHLQASFETISLRVPDDSTRPLWNEKARSLFEGRKEAYGDADLVVDTEAKTIEQVSDDIFHALPMLPQPTGVILPDVSYPVYIGKGIFRDIRSLMRRHIVPEGVFALVDENVMKHHGRLIERALGRTPSFLMSVPPGEDSKSYSFLKRVLDEMFTHRVNRQWVCLAVGGGVTGDLAGFAASIYMRGIPVIQVGTTLLSQVDSSIGGKTGINNEYGKNLVGSFYQPVLSLSDIDFLATLDEAQVKSAMAEVIKYGIIIDSALFEYIENGPPYDYEKIVFMCARDKARVVSEDEREGGLRRILNFGHTLGHAIEKSSDFTILHGEAVAVGMLFSSWLSRERGILSDGEFVRIRHLIDREGLIPATLSLPHPQDIARAISLDKKGEESSVHFVLTPSIGDASVRKLSEIEVLEAYRGFADGYAAGL